MARNRMIKPKYWEDIKISKLSRDARLLYIAMWNFADDMGVIPGDSVYIKSKCFPYDQIQLSQFEKWLTELSQGGFTYQFSHRDENFMYLLNFLKHQRIDRPNYDDLFVKKDALDRYLSTFDDCSTIVLDSIIDEVKVSKEEVKVSKVKKAPTAFDDFEIAFNDFLEMRKKMKKSPTDRAIELLKDKLEKLSGGEVFLKIKILEQSTVSCWQDVFPLKNNQKDDRGFIAVVDNFTNNHLLEQ